MSWPNSLPQPQKTASDGGNTADNMTVLTTFGPLATKTVGRDPMTGRPAVIASYGDAAMFTANVLSMRNQREMFLHLGHLQPRPRSFSIRGELLPGVDPRRCRRLLHPMREADGTMTTATFREAARRWFACDFDSVVCPSSLDWVNDPRGTASHLLMMLPRECAHAGCVIQATSSAGISDGIRVRTWHLADRPVTGAELSRWFATSPVDRSLYRTVQAHYTAAPVFEGISDPMPWRLYLVPGLERVAVPDLPEPPPRPPLARRAPALQPGAGSAYALAALEAECRQIACAAEGDRHQSLNRAAFKLARFVASGELQLTDVTRCLIAAGEAAGLTDGEAELTRFLAFGLEAGLRGATHAA